jgi:hypothetical protein
MQAFCMAPSSALAVVLIFYVLRRLFLSDKTALWLALLYAFGTPAFFRTGYLNQNLMLGHIGFAGFVALWNPGDSVRWSLKKRYFLAGFAGGTALLFDYSGAIFLLGLFAYGIFKSLRAKSETFRHTCWYVLGALAPVALLWFYQWKSFGNPFLPGQHWMPIIEWVRPGYRGFTFPQPDLIFDLAFDYRYGLFVSSPILLLALLAPFLDRNPRRLPKLELELILALFAGLWLFFSTFHGVLVQYNTGIRYMAPIFPFLFLPAAIMLMRLPRLVIYLTAVLVVTESWCLAMYRDVEQGFGLFNPVLHVFTGGFMLPALTTLSRMQAFSGLLPNGASPLPLFTLTAAFLYAVWSSKLAPGDFSKDYEAESDG